MIMAKTYVMKNIKTKELDLWYEWNDTKSNRKKLELMKYDPTLNKKVLYRQARKIK